MRQGCCSKSARTLAIPAARLDGVGQFRIRECLQPQATKDPQQNVSLGDSGMGERWLILCIGLPAAGIFASDCQLANIVILLFADDLGYGDPGSYGNPYIRTLHLD